jgi:hypothetical protein
MELIAGRGDLRSFILGCTRQHLRRARNPKRQLVPSAHQAGLAMQTSPWLIPELPFWTPLPRLGDGDNAPCRLHEDPYPTWWETENLNPKERGRAPVDLCWVTVRGHRGHRDHPRSGFPRLIHISPRQCLQYLSLNDVASLARERARLPAQTITYRRGDRPEWTEQMCTLRTFIRLSR